MADFIDDNENFEDDDDIIILYDEAQDKDEEFYHLATLDVDGKWYIVMKPVEPVEGLDENELLIYEIVDDEEGNETFVAIEDEDVLEKVFNEFMAEVEKYENEEDED